MRPPSSPPIGAAQSTEGRAPEPGRVRVHRVLVVDDNAMNRDTLARRLERKGYDVESVGSGEEALAAMGRRRFDIVLLDWMMPGMNGLQVLRRIRETWTAIELPVIMSTARSESDDVVEALKAEANDYVTKPLNFDVVHARMRTQLALSDAHRDLQANEHRYRALLENTGDMVVQFQVPEPVTYVSPASRTLLGFEPSHLQQRPFLDWLHPADRRALEQQFGRQGVWPPAFTFIARMERQDKQWIWVETSGRVLREGNRTVVHAACRDVTGLVDRVLGDEPPLPLGGDLMAHPGWRAPSWSRSSVEDPPPPVHPRRPVVVTVVVGEADPDGPEDLVERVAAEVRRALGSRP